MGKSSKKNTKARGSSSQVSGEDVVATHANQTENMYHCKLCAYTSDHRTKMRLHLQGPHSLGVGAGWNCEDCGKHFKLMDSLNRHKKSCKSQVKNEDVVSTHAKLDKDNNYWLYSCKLEGTHSLGADWDCEVCGKHFKSSALKALTYKSEGLCVQMDFPNQGSNLTTGKVCNNKLVISSGFIP